MARVILDTGVLVAVVRRRVSGDVVSGTDDVALPAIAVAEFLTGVELDPDPERRAAHRTFLDDVLRVVPVADYTAQTAVHHAALLAHTRRTGRPRGPHDLIVAATARATGRVLVTTDGKADFGDMPELSVRLLTP